jgi:hypothetical protein
MRKVKNAGAMFCNADTATKYFEPASVIWEIRSALCAAPLALSAFSAGCG